MKKGDTINGYRLLADFTTAGGGLGMWTFVQKGGDEYFLKQFLSPTYPTDDSPGTEKVKQHKREACRIFEEEHRRLMKATKAAAADGNLVTDIDFFRAGAKYYKVSAKVDVVDGLDPAAIALLSIPDRFTILLTVVASLIALHSKHIVHGDLKPANILIKRTPKSYAARLIDFDSSYFSAAPPIPEETVGDPAYYSPELLRYIVGSDEDGRKLTEKSDIFALGLIFSEYLSGKKVPFDRDKYQYPAEAVTDGVALDPPPSDAPDSLQVLIHEMLAGDPEVRPSAFIVQQRVKEVQRTLGAVATFPSTGPTTASTGGVGRSTLTGGLLDKMKSRLATASGPPDSSPIGTPLRGALLDKRKSGEESDAGAETIEATSESETTDEKEERPHGWLMERLKREGE